MHSVASTAATRAQPRPPTRATACRRTLCKNVQNFVSHSVIGTRGRGGAAGKLVSGKERRWRLVQSCEDGDEMCDGIMQTDGGEGDWMEATDH